MVWSVVNSSIWPIDWNLPDTITPGLCRPESNSNESVAYILQSSRIRTSPSDGLVSHPRHSLQRCKQRILQRQWIDIQTQSVLHIFLEGCNKGLVAEIEVSITWGQYAFSADTQMRKNKLFPPNKFTEKHRYEEAELSI